MVDKKETKTSRSKKIAFVIAVFVLLTSVIVGAVYSFGIPSLGIIKVMDFPYYEIRLEPKRLSTGKYKAVCSLSEYTGDKVHVILPKWELERVFDSKDAANRIMRLNAVQYLKREYSLNEEDLKRVKISEVNSTHPGWNI